MKKKGLNEGLLGELNKKLDERVKKLKEQEAKKKPKKNGK